MLRTSLALLASLVLAGCNNIVRSERCASYLCLTAQASPHDYRYQTYALPVTLVDFTFTKPQSGPLALSTTPRNVPDPDPNFWYQLVYDPHAGADDEVTLSVSNGLLHSTDAASTTQLPDVVELLSPVVRAGADLSAAALAPAIERTVARQRWSALSRGDRRDRILAQGPDDVLEIKPYSASVTCEIDTLVAGASAVRAASAGARVDTGSACAFQVGTRVRNVRLDCATAERAMRDLDELRLLFGPVTRTANCSGANQNQGTFAFEYTESLVLLAIGVDDAPPAIRDFWTTASVGGALPSATTGCASERPASGCFPGGTAGSVFYRVTAPLQTRAVACLRQIEFSDSEPPAPGQHCIALADADFAFVGATQRFPAIVRRAAFALQHPRGIGEDDRKYTFANGVLQEVQIERTGALLGAIRLPLTVLGIGDD